nr:MAG TPA: hypothetical protein [Bacteriophage sp.]
MISVNVRLHINRKPANAVTGYSNAKRQKMHWNEKSGRYGVNISLIFWRVKTMCNDPNVTERKSATLLDNWQNKGDRDRSPVGTKEIKRIANNATFAAGGQCDQCAGLLVGYSCSLALRRWSSSRATATSCPISSAALTPIFSTCASASSEETRGFSPLPSAWRRAISPRMAVTMNPALLSPSSFTDSMPSKASCGIRIEICFDLSLIVFFAMCILLNKRCDSVYTKKNHKKHLTCDSVEFNLNHTSVRGCKRQRPELFAAVVGRLTKPLNEVTIMAGTQHTQTHPEFIYTCTALHRDRMADGVTTVHVAADTLVDARRMVKEMGYVAAFWKGRKENTLFIQKCENNFIWRFIALSTAQPRVITIEATSEQEARQQSPAGCVMVFTARIRQGEHYA